MIGDGPAVPGGTDRFHPALLQERVGGEVRCLVCERRCTLSGGQTGWCRTRQNREGVLYTLIYGLLSSLSANPIEKKPFCHFYPGSVALTAGSYSCNAYFPAYRYMAPPTPVETLERARQIGLDEGLSFVYLGNVAGHRGGDTFCPRCGTRLIRRHGLDVCENVLDQGCCPRCGYRLPGRYG